jgi:protoheme IX farnesyltransferase
MGRAGLAAAYAGLVKPRIVGLVLFTAVGACVVAAAGSPDLATLGLLLASGFLSAGGSAALNHYFDRDIDARMLRTRRRPLAQGLICHPRCILVGGTAMVLAGVGVALLANPALALFLGAGAFVYVVVYTRWLKRRTWLNIVIGGLAGSFAVLGGWAAVDPALGLAPRLLAGIVFFWTPAHFWSFALVRAEDYQRAGVPMLPSLVGPVAASRWVFAHMLATVVGRAGGRPGSAVPGAGRRGWRLVSGGRRGAAAPSSPGCGLAGLQGLRGLPGPHLRGFAGGRAAAGAVRLNRTATEVNDHVYREAGWRARRAAR